jgi:hypothetical protein
MLKNTPVKDFASEARKKLRPYLDHREAECRHAHPRHPKGRAAATSAEKNPGCNRRRWPFRYQHGKRVANAARGADLLRARNDGLFWRGWRI